MRARTLVATWVLVALVGHASAAPLQYLATYEGDLTVPLDVANPGNALGSCTVHANCHDLRGVALEDHVIPAPTSEEMKNWTQAYRWVLIGEGPHRTLTTYQVCWYDAELVRLGCGVQNGGFMDEIPPETRHVRVLLYAGAAASYTAWLYAVGPDA